MVHNMDPVFGTWVTQRQIGSGTDGKVFTIRNTNSQDKDTISSLKVIRIGENKGERKSPYQKSTSSLSDEQYYETTIKSITDNIDIVMKTDAGKHFVKYEEYEKRPSSDAKGWTILIRMERMKCLTELLEQFSFTHDEVVRLGISICQALIKCRSFGYVYPNLKPENVLFDKNGVCKLGDFGTFSLIEPSRAAIAYKRTQYYMAPEFIKSGKVNCTVDTYSLGLIMYMLVNRNRLPFVEPYPKAVTVSSLNESMQSRIKGLELPQPQVSTQELNAIIFKACNFKENKRYLSPKQMLADLKRILGEVDGKLDEKQEQDDEQLEFSAEQEKLKSAQSKFVSTEQNIQQILPDTNSHEPSEIEKFKQAIEKSIIEEEQKICLKEEIQIPDVSSQTYYEAKEKTEKDGEKEYAKLPVIKKSFRFNTSEKKKIAILSILALILLLLFVASLILFVSKDNEPMVTANISYCCERWGILLWQLN